MNRKDISNIITILLFIAFVVSCAVFIENKMDSLYQERIKKQHKPKYKEVMYRVEAVLVNGKNTLVDNGKGKHSIKSDYWLELELKHIITQHDTTITLLNGFDREDIPVGCSLTLLVKE